MDIQITDKDAKYIWDTMGLKSADAIMANDECWMGDDAFYSLYEYEGLVVRAVYTVLDGNAEMDTNQFADWDNPDYLAIVGDASPEDYE